MFSFPIANNRMKEKKENSVKANKPKDDKQQQQN